MAKVKGLKPTRDLGEVTKRLDSGMFETNKNEKIPPFPGVTIGTKLKLENGRFVIVSGRAEDKNTIEQTQSDDAVLRRLDDLETKLAAKEAEIAELKRLQQVGTDIAPDAQPKNPPKVEE